jgi:hypothetical protein
MTVNLKSCLSYLTAVFVPKKQNRLFEANAPSLNPHLLELAKQGLVEAQTASREYHFGVATEEGRVFLSSEIPL